MLRSFFVTLIFISSLIAYANDNPHLIAVNGVAEVTVDPNMAIIQIDSWAKAPTAKAAQERQADQYKRIKAVIEKFKIKDEDFKTESFSVNPDYSYDQKAQKNKVTGFFANHYVNITFKKVSDAGALVDELISVGKQDTLGGVSIQNLAWDTDKRDTYENEAIGQAVKGARSRAEELAKAAGVKIKAVHRISHTSYTPQQTFLAASKSRGMMESDASVGGTELSSGKIKIRVDVQMEFEI